MCQPYRLCRARRYKTLIKIIGYGKEIRQRNQEPQEESPLRGDGPVAEEVIEDIICYTGGNEHEKLILLIDYKIDDSVIEKNDDGTPKRRIAIRYKLIDHVVNPDADEPTYVWQEKEYYSFSGSKVMIDQAEEDFSREDLPLVTVVQEFVNKQRKKFYKFT